MTEADLAEKTELRAKLLSAEKLWRKAFMEEMRLLIGIELMPQERKANGYFIEVYQDAAEHRHLDR